MIQTQTFDVNKEAKAELLVLSEALDLMGKKQYTEAAQVLIKRKDELMAEPKLKLYDPRAA